MLAQVSTVVFTTGLPGIPPITQFPALPAEQDTVYRARCTAHKNIRFSGRDTLLPREPYMRQTWDIIYV
jgi:hypothetical protein